MFEILLSAYDNSPRELIHVKLAARALKTTLDGLRQLTDDAGVEWFNEDHLSLDDYKMLTARCAKKERPKKNPSAKLFIIEDEIYVTIATAAIILNEKFATLWKWIVYDHLMELKPLYRGGLVKLADVNTVKQTPFFSQKRYTYAQIGKIYKVSRQTIHHWDKVKLVETTVGPGGQKYILESECPVCVVLSGIAHLFTPGYQAK